MYARWRRSQESVHDMSNPARQMNHARRLPPLPGPGGGGGGPKRGQSPFQYPGRFSGGLASPGYLSKTPEVKANGRVGHHDMMVTGHPLGTSGGSLAVFSPEQGQHISSYDLNPDVVSAYLLDNPEYLERFVLTHVGADQLERWMSSKTSSQKYGRRKSGDVQHGMENSNVTMNDIISKWKTSLQGDKRRLLQEMTSHIHQSNNQPQVLSELAACVAAAINADGFHLYLVDDMAEEVYFHKLNSSGSKATSPCRRPIGSGSILAAYCAHTKEGLRLNEFVHDERFPEGLGVGGDMIHSVLAIPVLQHDGDIVGVMELFRNDTRAVFSLEEEELTSSFVVWGSVAVHCAEMYHGMTKQRRLNEFLLTVTKSIFQDIVSMDNVIMKIMNYAQKLVDADRASLFLVDNRTQEIFARIFDIGNGRGARPADMETCDIRNLFRNTQMQGKMNYAKKLVNADRTALFLLDTRTKELYARVFDMGDDNEGNNNTQTQKEIRFPMNKGVAGYVASTGQILNIPDAYADQRFNREVDAQTGYTTKTILCMPIYIRGSIIGVVQMVNKLNGIFVKADEESFETFAVYCGLALHHAKLYEKIRRSEQKYKVALEVLSYHSKANEDEIDSLKTSQLPEVIPHITEYPFSPWSVGNREKPKYVVYMFRDLYDQTRFDMNNLYRFTLTVRKNYRPVPYHNWEHAFSVAHAMYTILKTTENVFTPLEKVGLFTACLCHDLDHRGKTNSFMVKSASPLAAIYSTSTMEHHHFNQTVAILQCLSLFVACLCHDVDHRGYTNQFMVQSASPLATIYSTSTMEHHHFNHTITILQNDGHNIFKHLTSEEYKQVLGDIKHCILATDLALFFPNRAKLKDIVDRGDFAWETKDHRMLLMAISMTASDLCSMYKPWDLQVQLVRVIMEEFWQQGDEEKATGTLPIPMMDRDKASELPNSQGDEERRSGLEPLAMMDREKQDELPKLEVGFLVGICLPCYELMASVLPESHPMVDGAKDNLRRWQDMADKNQAEEEKLQQKAILKSQKEQQQNSKTSNKTAVVKKVTS